MKLISTILLLSVCFSSCSQNDKEPLIVVQNDSITKSYWYNNEAEISSYELTQARYGELHKGHVVLVYVTEPFSKEKNAKPDKPTNKDISVLKLNFTKKFTTGIYPYSMMTSSFFPFKNGEYSLKISSSSQEWCGHTYMELKSKKKFEVKLSSYFENQTFDNLSLDKTNLEDDLWSIVRLNPGNLPTGEIEMVPSFFYLRLMHKALKAYKCETSKEQLNDSLTTYSITYPELKRTLTINFETTFPYKVLSWKETYESGWGENKKEMTTTANLITTIKSDYWNKHSNKNSDLRLKLGLE